MILGVGTDILEIDRVREVYRKFGGRFLSRIFTPGEVDYCLGKSDPVPSLAARFAAKEAVFKAVNKFLGFKRIPWREIEITRAESGAPHVKLHNVSGDGFSVHVSLSHSRTHVSAVAILEKQEDG